MAAHTILLFSGSCAAGKAAARALHVRLLGDVQQLFPAALFGAVHMETVSHPFLVSLWRRSLAATWRTEQAILHCNQMLSCCWGLARTCASRKSMYAAQGVPN